MSKTYFLICLTLFIFLFSQCKGENVKAVFSFENSKIRKEFIATDDCVGTIQALIYSKGQTVPLTTNEIPYFRFCLNHEIVSSLDKIWQFKNVCQRKMRNEGTEYILSFEVSDGKFAGLELKIYQQFFPNSDLVREKLVLYAKDASSFTLNKEEGQNLFEFPCYQVKTDVENDLLSHEIRIGSWELKPTTFGKVQKGNHMFYPNIIESKLSNFPSVYKGPVIISSDGKINWFTAYEHASQDNTNGLFDMSLKSKSKFLVDAMQGTKGVFNFEVKDSDFWFMGIENQKVDRAFEIKVKALRGSYYDGEILDQEHPYSSVWTATAFYNENKIADGKQILRNYLLNQICENPASRKTEYYYNTWGMQRSDPNKPLRGILTYERIFEEIEHAAELGVDVFVLDDGWEQAQGDWIPNKERLPQGLAPIKKKLDQYGMKMGLWFSPMGVDTTTQRYKDHPEWVIKDSEGNPIQAQWGHPAFDFVSGFCNLFVDDCKKMIDQGCRYMKWDAINTFYCSLPNLYHGDSTISEEERRARYEYLLPIFVTRAMKELTEYEPDLVIELDLTEARRVMVGLIPLSQGKLFWMNNGASGYNDYSIYRSMSMRTIANEYAGIIPWELLTYANYPHNQSDALIYNTTNSILAGNGFWGNLALMTQTERRSVGEMLETAKRIQPFLYGINPVVMGKVGDSPETYKIVNDSVGAGLIIGFSLLPTHYSCKTFIPSGKVLAVLNSSYQMQNDTLYFDMDFTKPESSFLANILPGINNSVGILSSTTILSKAEFSENELVYQCQAKGLQTVRWDVSLGKPKITSKHKLKQEMTLIESEHRYLINIETTVNDQIIKIMRPSENKIVGDQL